MVEVAGIEPASRKEDPRKTTCLVSVLVSSKGPPADRLSVAPAH
jgi:hypothetical protein